MMLIFFAKYYYFILSLIIGFATFASDDVDQLQSTAEQGVPTQKAQNGIQSCREEYECLRQIIIERNADVYDYEYDWINDLLQKRLALYRAYVDYYPELSLHKLLWFLEVLLDVKRVIIECFRGHKRLDKSFQETLIEKMTKQLVESWVGCMSGLDEFFIFSAKNLLNNELNTRMGAYHVSIQCDKLYDLLVQIQQYKKFEVLSKKLHAAIGQGKLLEVFLIFKYHKIKNFLRDLSYDPLVLAGELEEPRLVQFFTEIQNMEVESPVDAPGPEVAEEQFTVEEEVASSVIITVPFIVEHHVLGDFERSVIEGDLQGAFVRVPRRNCSCVII